MSTHNMENGVLLPEGVGTTHDTSELKSRKTCARLGKSSFGATPTCFRHGTGVENEALSN